jgi:hypothetical protein
VPYSWPVTPDDVDAHLNIDASSNPELQGFIDSITRVVEAIVGPVTPTQYVEWHDGGSDTIVLNNVPVVGIDTVIEFDRTSPTTLTVEALDATPPSFTAAGVQFDPATGKVFRTNMGTPKRFPAGRRNVKFIYTAGRAEVTANIREAALELIRLHWRPQRSAGPSTLPGERGEGGGEGADQVILGFLVPGKVLDTLTPDRVPPAVA